MSHQSIWQQKLTDVVKIDAEVAYQTKYIIWFNPLNSNSLRLTKEGYQYFTNRANYKFYTHILKNMLLPVHLVQMEKHITCPYFVNNLTKVSVFEQELSMVITLYNDDLQQYLAACDQTR